jgi:hypothetical protein
MLTHSPVAGLGAARGARGLAAGERAVARRQLTALERLLRELKVESG